MMLPFEKALAILRAQDLTPLPIENVPLSEALGRIVARDIYARLSHPPFTASAMDGYALSSADLQAGQRLFHVIGKIMTGQPFQGNIQPGEALRIFTGGMLAEGADTVVIQEKTQSGDKPDQILITEGPSRQSNVRQKGSDINAGARIMKAGTKLSSRDIALAAAVNHTSLPAFRQPRIGFFTSGDELVPPGTTLQPGQIVNSNRLLLESLIQGFGAQAVYFGHLSDNRNSLIKSFTDLDVSEVDVLVTTGGASVGEPDLLRSVLEDLGMQKHFWKVAIRPGKPVFFGTFQDKPLLGLPGNPVSCFVTAVVFLRSLLLRLLLQSEHSPPFVAARLEGSLQAGGPRVHFLRAVYKTAEEGAPSPYPLVTPLPSQDSGFLSPLAAANCLLMQNAGSARQETGVKVQILRFCDIGWQI